jgi:hypothetical protein
VCTEILVVEINIRFADVIGSVEGVDTKERGSSSTMASFQKFSKVNTRRCLLKTSDRPPREITGSQRHLLASTVINFAACRQAGTLSNVCIDDLNKPSVKAKRQYTSGDRPCTTRAQSANSDVTAEVRLVFISARCNQYAAAAAVGGPVNASSSRCRAAAVAAAAASRIAWPRATIWPLTQNLSPSHSSTQPIPNSSVSVPRHPVDAGAVGNGSGRPKLIANSMRTAFINRITC